MNATIISKIFSHHLGEVDTPLKVGPHQSKEKVGEGGANALEVGGIFSIPMGAEVAAGEVMPQCVRHSRQLARSQWLTAILKRIIRRISRHILSHGGCKLHAKSTNLP